MTCECNPNARPSDCDIEYLKRRIQSQADTITKLGRMIAAKDAEIARRTRILDGIKEFAGLGAK